MDMNAQIIKDEPSAYFGRMALSNSGMSELMRCPAHLKAMLDRCGQEDNTNGAFLAGSLFHCMGLEPSEVSVRYRLKANRGNTKAGKEEAEMAARDGVQLVSQDMWETCSAMAAAALRHPVMRSAHAAGDLRTEQSVYWTELNGTVPCKARVDALVTLPNYGLCAIDLKTTRDASLSAIEKSLYTYGYHRQAAWYRRGLRSAGMDVRGFLFLFVEKEPPYLTVATSISEGAQALALDEIKDCVETFAGCMASGVWPGYTESPVIELDLPAWAYKRNQ